MLLRDYLLENDLTYTAAAELFGCSRPSVYYYAIGRMRPGARITANIMRETGGKVTADDHQLAYMKAQR
jgi:DNA-binding transcriptional regulator YdaS (Cro superfamily)